MEESTSKNETPKPTNERLSMTAYMKQLKVPHEKFSETFWDSGQYGRLRLHSVELIVETQWYRVKRVRMVYDDCFGASYHGIGDWDKKHLLCINEPDAVSKLMCKFSAHDGKTLFQRMKERFSPYGCGAFDEFKKFLDKKQIKYSHEA